MFNIVNLFNRTLTIEKSMYLHGAEVYLHPMRVRDGRDWVKLRNQSRDFIEPFEPLWAQGEIKLEDYRRRRENLLRDMQADRGYGFLMRRRIDDVLLGGLNLYHLRRQAMQCASISYWIGKDYARQSYMKAGLPLLLQFAFNSLKLHRIEAYCLPYNIASFALLKGAGFHEEGMAIKYLRIQGEWQDHLRFALINPLV